MSKSQESKKGHTNCPQFDVLLVGLFSIHALFTVNDFLTVSWENQEETHVGLIRKRCGKKMRGNISPARPKSEPFI